MHGLKIITGIVLISLVVAIGFWFDKNFERVPVEVETELRGAARHDPILAVRRLFSTSQIPARFMAYHHDLPPIDGTLVFLGYQQSRTSGQVAEILDWVNKGGHVIVVAKAEKEDPLLSDWLVESFEDKYHDDSVSISLLKDETLDLTFERPFELSHNGEHIFARAGAKALIFRSGKGFVTALSESELFDNENLGEADNAVFLWRLTHLQRSGAVWFVTGNDTASSPWSAILDRTWPFLISLAVLIIGFAWTRCRRFGPKIPEGTGQRPRLLDHIRASGEFCWRSNSRDVLLEAVQDSVLRTIKYRRPRWLSTGNRDEQIATFCDVPQIQVTQAFSKDEPTNKHAFTQAIATLETIRNRL